MNRIYVPLTTAAQWQALLAKPEHWRDGYSAKLLATSWMSARGFPRPVAQALDGSGITSLERLELVAGIPEYPMALPGGRRSSYTDLLALARGRDGLVTLAVEGKARESFGPLVNEWKSKGTRSGKPERLAYLCRLLEVDERAVEDLRYQLLHRAASALLAAEQFGSRHAVLLVHAFPGAEFSLPDFEAFAGVLASKAGADRIVPVGRRHGRDLYLGWVGAGQDRAWTLYEEIGRILRDDGGRLTATEIAKRVNDIGRYRKRDGSLVQRGQVSARVSKHPELFVRTPDGIVLRDPLAVGARSLKG